MCAFRCQLLLSRPLQSNRPRGLLTAPLWQSPAPSTWWQSLHLTFITMKTPTCLQVRGQRSPVCSLTLPHSLLSFNHPITPHSITPHSLTQSLHHPSPSPLSSPLTPSLIHFLTPHPFSPLSHHSPPHSFTLTLLSPLQSHRQELHDC